MRRPSKGIPSDPGGQNSLKTGSAASGTAFLSAHTKSRPSLAASPNGRIGSPAADWTPDRSSGEGHSVGASEVSSPENLGQAFHRSLSGSAGVTAVAPSPRSSLASGNDRSVKDLSRRTQLGSVGENVLPRPVHHPSSPSSGSRLSVIQVQPPPPHVLGSPGSRRSGRGSVDTDGTDAAGGQHQLNPSQSAGPSAARASNGEANRPSYRSSIGEMSLGGLSKNTDCSSSKSASEPVQRAGREPREVQTPPVVGSRAWQRGSCSTADSQQPVSSTDSESSPSRFLAGTARSSGSNVSRPSTPRPYFPVVYAMRRKAAPRCRYIIKNKLFQAGMFGALLAALFLPDLWVLLDRPNNDDLDGILSFVLVLFLVELVVQSIGLTRTYWGSFFFWMDLLGAASLLLDLSYLPFQTSPGGTDSGSNVVILRAARIAKLGARAGRFTRLAKLLRFLPFMQDMQGSDQGTAKVISARLITSLSMRVSCLIIVMVITMPIFGMWTYPGQDWSMTSWIDILDAASSQYPDSFHDQVLRFGAFYEDMGYYPYRLTAKSGAALPDAVLAVLPWEPPRGPPQRAANSLLYEGTSLVCEFNFKRPFQIDALMNILLLVVIMGLMVGWSLMLSNFVSAQVLRPLEKLLLQVRKMASTIFKSVSDMTVTMASPAPETSSQEVHEDDAAAAFDNETELLERVVAKLGVLSQIATSKNAVDPDVMEDLGAADRAVIRGFQGHGSVARPSEVNGDIDEEFDLNACRLAQKAMVENAGLSLELIDSNNLNPLELDRARTQAAAMYVVSQLHHGLPFDAVTMHHFLEACELGYVKSNTYHNWFHAVDVAHCVYRLLRQCSTEQYLSGVERFGLLVSAVCHDIGHPGVNNIYLVETAHELALRYNDKSPLENMHCARLFELTNTAKCNVFSQLSKHQYLDIRKVCIEVILHTDNAQHFVMIKEVQMFYEVHSEILDAMRLSNEYISVFSLTSDAVEFFGLPESRKLLAKLFLHFADISNCMKPFRICQIWAKKIMEEFFMQGDLEKTNGVPVQALNDREKVNRAFSQVGFIEFLVSPLMFVAVKVLSPLESYGEQMMSNVKRWHQIWLAETQPEPTESEQKAVAERIMKLSNKFLATHLATHM